MGTIVPMDSGRFLARWYVSDGRDDDPDAKRRLSQSFDTRAEAEVFLNLMEGGFDVDVLNRPLHVALSAWILCRETNEAINKKTAERERNIVDNYRRTLGAVTVRKVTIDGINGALKKMKRGEHRSSKNGKPGRGLALRTRRQHLRVLKAFFATLQETNVLKINPASAVRLGRVSMQDPKEPNQQQVEALLAAAQERATAANGNLPLLITLVEFTGIRRGEALALTENDFDRRRCRLSVTKSLGQTKAEGIFVKGPKSEKGNREIEIPSWFFDLLDRHLSDQRAKGAALGDAYRDRGLVFADAYGGYLKPDTISGQVGQLKQQVGWPKDVAGMHGLRHKFGSTLARSTIPVKDIAHALGHADEGFTLRTYVARRPEPPKTAHLFAQRPFGGHPTGESVGQD